MVHSTEASVRVKAFGMAASSGEVQALVSRLVRQNGMFITIGFQSPSVRPVKLAGDNRQRQFDVSFDMDQRPLYGGANVESRSSQKPENDCGPWPSATVDFCSVSFKENYKRFALQREFKNSGQGREE
ncbi:hypothetical protein KIN20_028254 [Parelaphostrongylus tenuis]|uniref:Uncharacterized protein n=1 Tax=Parelaphostrongylus tenuis TaxID=148309 RepID=A0AAD5WEJ4_PARTN|nr:hypothetical protein KIN20_028254 [Parelaphostrongylus tenuis]